MVTSIGSSVGSSLASTVKPIAGLDAQILQYKKELMDCVTCESSKTTKGKAHIQALSAKINALTSQVEQASNAKTASPRIVASERINTHSVTTPPNKELATAMIKNTPTPVSEPIFTPIGSRLDVFA